MSSDLTKAQRKALTDRVRRALRQDLFVPVQPGVADSAPYVGVSYRAKTNTLKIEWAAGPRLEAVTGVVAPLAAETGVKVAYQRAQQWSCGLFHQSAFDAWKNHQGSLYETIEGACPCCGEGGESRLTEETLERLRSEGETFEPPCYPGEFAFCGLCHWGREILENPTRLITCRACGGQPSFDLDTPDGRGAYAEAQTRARRLIVEKVTSPRRRSRLGAI